MKKTIIGLTGKAGSGKDTAASFIPGAEILSFAEPLKKACKELFNFTDEQLYDFSKKEEVDERWNKSPREILQWLGTDILRNQINTEFFVRNMENRINNSQSDIIIITDVRFDNEAEFIKNIGGTIIKILRPGAETTDHNSHITEQGISDFLVDFEIINDSTIEKFKKDILIKIL